MKILIIIFLYFLPLFKSFDPDVYKTFTEYLESYKYPFQQHYITTTDNYILKIFRIQTKFQSKIYNITSQKVLLLMHGFGDSSDNMILNKEEWAPALYFANHGYDVWLGNVRGNKHSRNHTFLKPDKDKEFWEFSLDEFINFDLPDTCEFIYNFTNGKKIYYIGHSQGSTIMFAALAEKNKIIHKTIEKFLSFGPVVYTEFAKKFNLLKTIVDNPIMDTIIGFLEYKGGEFFIPDFIKNSLINAICPSVKFVCDSGLEAVLQVLIDADPKVDYMKRSEVFLSHYPGGTSVKAMIHWYQLLQTNGTILQKYDFGKEINLKKYGQDFPPIYDVKQIGKEVPIYFYIGYFDRLGTKQDINKLYKEIINTANIKKKRIYPMGHSSFVWGRELTYFLDDVNEDILDCECKNNSFKPEIDFN